MPTRMILSTPDCKSTFQPLECKPSPFYKPELYKPSPDRTIIDESGAITPPSLSPIPFGLRTPRRPSLPKFSPQKSSSGKKHSAARKLFTNLLEQSSLYASTGTRMESPSLHATSPHRTFSNEFGALSTHSSPPLSSNPFDSLYDPTSPSFKKSRYGASLSLPESHILTRSAAKQTLRSVPTSQRILDKPSRGRLFFKEVTVSLTKSSPPFSSSSFSSPSSDAPTVSSHISPPTITHSIKSKNYDPIGFSSPYHLRRTPQRALRLGRQSNSFLTSANARTAHCM